MFFSRDCRRTKVLLWDVAVGSAADSDKARAEAHLAHCEACRAELESYRNTAILIASYRQQPVPVSHLGWRDVERRVSADPTKSIGWARRPSSAVALQFGLGGGALAVTTLLVMLVMQANMNPSTAHSGSSAAESPGIAGVTHSDSGGLTGAETAGVNSMLSTSLVQIPKFPEGAAGTLRSARPQTGHSAVRLANLAPIVRSKPSTRPQSAGTDDELDGAGQRQALRPEYVLASASSGSEDDQNRRYVIDVVSPSSSSSTDASEESHPW